MKELLESFKRLDQLLEDAGAIAHHINLRMLSWLGQPDFNEEIFEAVAEAGLWSRITDADNKAYPILHRIQELMEAADEQAAGTGTT